MTSALLLTLLLTGQPSESPLFPKGSNQDWSLFFARGELEGKSGNIYSFHLFCEDRTRSIDGVKMPHMTCTIDIVGYLKNASTKCKKGSYFTVPTKIDRPSDVKLLKREDGSYWLSAEWSHIWVGGSIEGELKKTEGLSSYRLKSVKGFFSKEKVPDIVEIQKETKYIKVCALAP